MAEVVTVREERPGDGEGIAAVHVAAFGGAWEAGLVGRLRQAGAVELSLVAAAPSRVVGHVLFSRLPIVTAGGTISAMALAPLAVLPEWQLRGVGARLVERGLATLRGRGVPAAVVLGEPAYYGRFGFSARAAARIRSPFSGPALQALELALGGLGSGVGEARYHAAFFVG